MSRGCLGPALWLRHHPEGQRQGLLPGLVLQTKCPCRPEAQGQVVQPRLQRRQAHVSRSLPFGGGGGGGKPGTCGAFSDLPTAAWQAAGLDRAGAVSSRPGLLGPPPPPPHPAFLLSSTQQAPLPQPCPTVSSCPRGRSAAPETPGCGSSLRPLEVGLAHGLPQWGRTQPSMNVRKITQRRRNAGHPLVTDREQTTPWEATESSR